MTDPHASPLGKAVAYAAHYDPGLLFPIARHGARAELGITAALPFHGVDVWNAYELSWLDRRGKPQVALAELRVPAQSPNLVESKSLKLYLNSFASERIEDTDALRTRIERDLSHAAGGAVAVRLVAADAFAGEQLLELQGDCIDALDIAIDCYGPPRPEYLQLAPAAVEVDETLVSHLLKSNCPVTGQPDWASVQIRYRGRTIDRAGLLRYLVSFREHSGFHEQCVERIFIDVMHRCAPQQLSVYARYTRRGGLDINPWRSTAAGEPPNPRNARQ